MAKASQEGFAGISGVGALCLLGAFLIIDGRQGMTFPSTEHFAETATWTLIAAVPVLATTVVIGLLAIATTGWVTGLFRRTPENEEIDDLLDLARDGSPALIEQYCRYREQHDILNGSAPGFLLIAFGLISEIRNLSPIKYVMYLAAVAAVVIAVLSIILAQYRARRARRIVCAIRAQHSKLKVYDLV